MTYEEFAREFEKCPKNLMKALPNALLFAEDYPEGRMQLVCAAMNKEEKVLQESIARLMTREEGARHLVRTLNNLKTIGHHGALLFAQKLFSALEHDWDEETHLQKFMQILDSISADLRTGMDWIDNHAIQMLDEGHLSTENKVKLWLRWCAAVLRSSPEAAPLLENLCPRRPKDLPKSQIRALKDACDDDTAPWDIRSAAMYLLLGNRLISLNQAQSFVEQAYAAFPLEALEGVEILAIAVEHDASVLAEFDVIQGKLSQVRKENLILKDMKHDAFIAASERVFQSPLPQNAIDVALSLQSADKSDRMILTTFIDDARRADWFHVARKANALKSLGAIFFAHFDAQNPLLRAFSADFVTTLLENCNADALMAQTWCDAFDAEDIETLTTQASSWQAFCQA